MQPVPTTAREASAAGPADQHQERGLEGVVGVVRVAQDAPADAQHHGSVPAHEDGKGGLVMPGQETLEQLAVRQVAAVRP